MLELLYRQTLYHPQELNSIREHLIQSQDPDSCNLGEPEKLLEDPLVYHEIFILFHSKFYLQPDTRSNTAVVWTREACAPI